MTVFNQENMWTSTWGNHFLVTNLIAQAVTKKAVIAIINMNSVELRKHVKDYMGKPLSYIYLTRKQQQQQKIDWL